MILVTGATGTVGGAVARRLAEAGEDVRALVRSPEAARLPAAVDPVRGDLTDPASVEAAMHGVDGVFLVWPLPEAAPVVPVLEAVRLHAERVAYLSSAGVDPDAEEQGDPITATHAEVERALAASGLTWTAVRAGGFAANDLAWAESLSGGGSVVRTPFPEARRAVVHEDDLADVAIRALTAEGHGGRAYTVTGPEMLSETERVHVLGEEIGRPLKTERMGLDEARTRLTAAGLPAEAAEGILEAHRTFSDPSYTEERHTAQEVTGVPPRTYRQWAADHADAFR
ncbi:NAD(P)H-binding protein [Nocardiopsis sp. RSe5-2]|uniref:NAD(P)H-binding protein n=1 Tax=Nocardiopsis endophytica TaxID=3018445 RepID=A0ABT4U6L9_9ACTN|nr:NAD(P)H-binding protein [Nocardiopsis endophytica]MDA2812598.1 NAD(P)H-binding protein [Nocardiopsis endophytica]